MTKAVLFSAVLMLCTALALAQDTQPSTSSEQAGASASTSTADQTGNAATGNTIQGCVTGTSGHYMLTESTGVAYQLTGDESQLSANVNSGSDGEFWRNGVSKPRQQPGQKRTG
jgi:hypothetical protein